MGLHLGKEAVKLRMGQQVFLVHLVSVSAPAPAGVRLLSFDDFMLQDSNGRYLTAKEGE